jgi:GNAT superfamily N-acetyltransferase
VVDVREAVTRVYHEGAGAGGKRFGDLDTRSARTCVSLMVKPVRSRMGGVVEISLLTEADRTAWKALTRRYIAHAGAEMSDDGYERTWQRLVARDEIRGIAAWLDDTMVGIAHYLFHASIWWAGRCYMADLFVAPEVRRQGIATAMLEWVARDAEEHDAPRFYWNTELDNAGARALYDKVANYKGFIVYSYRRDPSPT